MAENSKIEWTDHTFNGWIGCTKVGPGCDHCYAEALATSRLQVPWGPGAKRRRTAASTWRLPYRWNNSAPLTGRRTRVFCSSLADVFDNEVPPEWRRDLFWLIRETPNLDWLLVTKRIGNAERMADAAGGWPDNVWLGATIVNQEEADRDIPKLLRIPVRYRFLSMEPLLGPVDLTNVAGKVPEYGTEKAHGTDVLTRHNLSIRPHQIDWVIVGGESGAHARAADGDWYRSIRDQCAAAGVPFLFKQHGEWIDVRDLRNLPGGDGPGFGAFDHCRYDQDYEAVRVGKKVAGRLLDGIQHDGVPASDFTHARGIAA